MMKVDICICRWMDCMEHYDPYLWCNTMTVHPSAHRCRHQILNWVSSRPDGDAGSSIAAQPSHITRHQNVVNSFGPISHRGYLGPTKGRPLPPPLEHSVRHLFTLQSRRSDSMAPAPCPSGDSCRHGPSVVGRSVGQICGGPLGHVFERPSRVEPPT